MAEIFLHVVIRLLHCASAF